MTFEPESTEVLTVAKLTELIKYQLNHQFSSIWVSGEISGISRPRSGHIYFTLKDNRAQIGAVIWRMAAQSMNFELGEGMGVICAGNVDVYPQRGNYQLIVRQIQPQGIGSLELAFRQLHAKLAAEGLFRPEHKQPLPRFPRRVAIITSPTGAAIRDFLQVIVRRWPNVHLLIIPVKVQGPGSAQQIRSAIDACGEMRIPPDVVVLTRGGGSIEDLWSFNEEIVCRAIFRCRIPTISAVGHEIDVTLADLVADVRALTPSEAAERLVPDQAELNHHLVGFQARMKNSLIQKLVAARLQLHALTEKPVLRHPLNLLRELTAEMDELDTKMRRMTDDHFKRFQYELSNVAARLEAINPLAVLARGYSITMNGNGQPITSLEEVEVGSRVVSQLAGGRLESRVEKVHLEPIPPINLRTQFGSSHGQSKPTRRKTQEFDSR